MPHNNSASRSRGKERENHRHDRDEGIAMEATEIMMSRLLRQETATLATKAGIKEIRQETRKNSERIDRVCGDVQDLRKQIQEVKQERAAGSAAHGTSGASSARGWRPRPIHFAASRRLGRAPTPTRGRPSPCRRRSCSSLQGRAESGSLPWTSCRTTGDGRKPRRNVRRVEPSGLPCGCGHHQGEVAVQGL